jgi:hypothetical protein
VGDMSGPSRSVVKALVVKLLWVGVPAGRLFHSSRRLRGLIEGGHGDGIGVDVTVL